MKILLQNIRVPVEEGEACAFEKARTLLRKLDCKPSSLFIYRKSVDARHKNDVSFVFSVGAQTDPVPEDKLKNAGAVELDESLPDVVIGEKRSEHRPLIAGFGPAGMFCALLLAENGYRPVVLERGKNVRERQSDVERFIRDGFLDPESNVQFGAGGAGTFSDGKLVTRINDPLTRYFIEKFVSFGAPRHILTEARPHVGTDLLPGIVDNIAARIVSLGGEIRYSTSLVSFEKKPYGYLASTSSGELPCSSIALCTGHSARDTYKYLASKGLSMTPKPFSVGVRIEQSNEEITRSLYGKAADLLGSAEYNFSFRRGEDAVYTFCMCPGGEVIASASESGGVVVNGMSASARNGRNSNSALAVSVGEKDYGEGLFAGMEFQRKLERAAFAAGGSDYSAPVQTVGDYIDGRTGTPFRRIRPTYRNGIYVRPYDLNLLFTPRINGLLKTGLASFEKKAKGFAPFDAVLTGVESRTSAPLRIERDPLTRSSREFEDVYPVGEGAGYAGGITSAAVDGIRTALKIMEKFRP